MMRDILALARRCANGDQDAIDMLMLFVRIAHVWDDLIDRDRDVYAEDINGVFTAVLLDVGDNPFYRQFQPFLKPVLVNAIVNWRVANTFEGEAGESETRLLEIAYILRSSFVDLFTAVAYITGGIEHAVDCGRDIRRATHHEGFAEYKKTLNSARKEQRG